MGETEEKEQVTKPSEEEEQAKEPSNVGEAVDDFYKEKAKEKPSEVETEKKISPAEEEKPEEKVDEKEKEKPESPEIPPGLEKLDALLKENPLVLDVDGKDVKVDSAAKLRTYGQFGYKGYDRQGELKKKEEELQKGADQLQNIIDEIETAKKEGRFIIKPTTRPSEEEQAEEEEEEDEELDPAIKDLKAELKKVKKDNEEMKMAFLESSVEQAYKKLNTEIEELTPKYKLCKRGELIHKLAEKDENDKPKYKTVEEAMKVLNEETKKFFDEYLKDNPDYQESTEEQKEQIIADYLAKEKEKTKAPVSSPAETSAGGAPTQKDEGDYPDAQTAYVAFQKQKKAEKEAGRKS